MTALVILVGVAAVVLTAQTTTSPGVGQTASRQRQPSDSHVTKRDVAVRPQTQAPPRTDTGVVSLMPAVLTLSGAILAAILGAFVKYVWDLRITKRKDKLERVNAQLKLLYGPLYVTDLAAQAVWSAFWWKIRRDTELAENERDVPFTEDEDKEWRIWVTEVFTPLNERIERTIVENADLLEGEGIPVGMLAMCAHIACYKAIRKKWQEGNFTENAAPIDYPWKDFRAHVVPTFEALKAEQARLLGHKAGNPAAVRAAPLEVNDDNRRR